MADTVNRRIHFFDLRAVRYDQQDRKKNTRLILTLYSLCYRGFDIKEGDLIPRSSLFLVMKCWVQWIHLRLILSLGDS